MDNLPKDPPDQINNSVPPPFGSGFNPHTNPIDPNNPYASQPQQPNYPQQPQVPIPEPLNALNTPTTTQQQGQAPFSPSITPNTPNVPENPDTLKHEHYSEVAQNKPRDEHGHFIHANPDPQTPQNTPNPSIPSDPSLPDEASAKPGFLPPIIEINQNTKPTEKEDPPLFGFFITNPVTYLKKFLSGLLRCLPPATAGY